MIEIPESINLAKQIDKHLSGKTISKIAANSSPHGFAWYSGDPADYPRIFKGKTVEGAYAYGGKLHVKMSCDCEFAFIDGVNLRYIVKGKLPAKHQLFVEFGDGTHLVCTISMYGGLFGYEGENTDGYDMIARTKPQVLSKDFSRDYFMSLLDGLNRAKYSVKAFLATEQRIPGLGNGVLQDILFNAAITPRRKLDTLEQGDFEELYKCVTGTIAQMTDEGGRDVEKDIFGSPGGYKTVLSRLTYESPCPRCGGVIKKEAYMGGSVYYCLSCQV